MRVVWVPVGSSVASWMAFLISMAVFVLLLPVSSFHTMLISFSVMGGSVCVFGLLLGVLFGFVSASFVLDRVV